MYQGTMTVAQLIEILQQQNPDAIVYATKGHYNGSNEVYELEDPCVLTTEKEIVIAPQNEYYLQELISIMSRDWLGGREIADFVNRHSDEQVISVPDEVTIDR